MELSFEFSLEFSFKVSEEALFHKSKKSLSAESSDTATKLGPFPEIQIPQIFMPFCSAKSENCLNRFSKEISHVSASRF